MGALLIAAILAVLINGFQNSLLGLDDKFMYPQPHGFIILLIFLVGLVMRNMDFEGFNWVVRDRLQMVSWILTISGIALWMTYIAGGFAV